MKINKPIIGRPRKYSAGKVNTSIRLTKEEKEKILKKFKTIQAFIEHSISNLS